MSGWAWKLFIGILLLTAVNLRAQNPTPCGLQLSAQGVYKGVPAYSNGADQWTEADCGESPGPYGDQYQCVEYVRRFYSIVFGMDTSKWKYYNADQYYANASKLGLVPYPNGGAVPPAPGDIVVFEGGSAGHVAIVMDVTSTGMDIIEQNWSLTGVAHLTLNSSGKYIRPNSHYTVLGWLGLQSSNTIIYNNFASGNSYFPAGWNVAGLTSTPGLVETAVSFVPSQNVYLSQLLIPLTWLEGSNSAVVTLNNDNAGVPGSTVYETWNLSGLPTFGLASTIQPSQILTSTSGIFLTAGTTYWIVAAPGASDTYDVWSQVSPATTVKFAQSNNGIWTVGFGTYPPGLEVTGAP